MAFDFICPKCGEEMVCEDDWVGMLAECPGCGEDVEIKSASPSGRGDELPCSQCGRLEPKVNIEFNEGLCSDCLEAKIDAEADSMDDESKTTLAPPNNIVITPPEKTTLSVKKPDAPVSNAERAIPDWLGDPEVAAPTEDEEPPADIPDQAVPEDEDEYDEDGDEPASSEPVEMVSCEGCGNPIPKPYADKFKGYCWDCQNAGDSSSSQD